MAIRWDKFTVKAQEAVQRANELASEHGNPELLPVHLLTALIEDKEGIVPPVLEKIGIGAQAVLRDAYQEIEKLPKVSGSGATQANLSQALNQLLERAFKEADNFKDEYVSTEHLLLAATQLKRDAAQEILARHGAVSQQLHELREILRRCELSGGRNLIDDPVRRGQRGGPVRDRAFEQLRKLAVRADQARPSHRVND